MIGGGAPPQESARQEHERAHGLDAASLRAPVAGLPGG